MCDFGCRVHAWHGVVKRSYHARSWIVGRLASMLSYRVPCRVSAPHGDRISDPSHRTSGRPADSVRSGRVGIRSRVCHRGRRACVVRALLDVEPEAIGRTGDAPSMLCGRVAFASCRVVTRVIV